MGCDDLSEMRFTCLVRAPTIHGPVRRGSPDRAHHLTAALRLLQGDLRSRRVGLSTAKITWRQSTLSEHNDTFSGRPPTMLCHLLSAIASIANGQQFLAAQASTFSNFGNELVNHDRHAFVLRIADNECNHPALLTDPHGLRKNVIHVEKVSVQKA